MFCLSRHFLLLVLKHYALLTYRKPLLQLFRGHFVISFSHILIEDGAPEGTRTPGLLLRRQLLYPAELLAQAKRGAGDGNRTHVTSLEGWNSTIELHPHVQRRSLATFDIISKPRLFVNRFWPFADFYLRKRLSAVPSCDKILS